MLSVDSEIRRAFDEGEFFPAFQPLVELKSGQLAGFEVLARWRHPKLGTISPEEFIPLIERVGFIDELTSTLLKQAFAAPALAVNELGISFNLTPLQLLEPGLCERIADAAQPAGFSMHRITVEITESALVDDLERAKAVADELKAMRCRLALDDFGTGYSSLKHLHTLPFDELKVDRSFVASMIESRESRKIVASVLGLGQSLGLKTVAEGVETREQANMLFWMGCDQVQGWLYGKPAPAHELAAILKQSPHRTSAAMPSPWEGEEMISLEVLPAQRLAQLQAVYDGAPVGLCFLDRELRYVTLNRKLAQMNGIPAEEHLGKTAAEVIPAVFPKVEPYMRRALAGEPVTGVEVDKPATAGRSACTLLASYQPAWDEAGEVLGISVAIMDVTERKNVEDALRESHAHYRHTLELTPHVLWVLDSQGNVIEGGAAWEKLTGLSIEESLGEGWFKALHPEDVAPTRAAIVAALTNGTAIDVVYRVRRADEPWKRIHSRGSARFGPSGEVQRIYGSLEVIEDRKQIEEAHRRLEDELHAILNGADAGLIRAEGPDGRIVEVNAEADRILRGAARPGQSMPDYALWCLTDMDGKPVPANEHPLSRALLFAESIAPIDLRIRNGNGSFTRLSCHAWPAPEQNGNARGAVLAIRAVSERQ